MKIGWNRPFNSKAQYLLSHVLWIFAVINFAIGEVNPQRKEEPFIENFVLACIIFSLIASIINYRRNPTSNLFLVIGGLLFWSIGFVLSREGIINDLIYGFFIGIFVCVVIFNNAVHKKK
jgi:hypothetical protein